jgi:magnesium-transporting ATPase (P-type)
MDKPPRSLKEHVITKSLLLRAYAFLGIIQSIAAMAAFYFMYWTNGHWGKWIDLPSTGWLYAAATAMTLAAVVSTQIGNVFAHRTGRSSIFKIGFFSNRMIWIGIATELALISLAVYAPFMHGIFGTAAFPLKNWLFLLAWAPSLLIADEMRKALLRFWARRTRKG